LGKSFKLELGQLEETYYSALSMDVSALGKGIEQSIRHPLIAVGSGGSLSAAHFACYLHQLASGLISKTATPLDIVSMLKEQGSIRSLIRSAIICLTAGGSNADINRSWRILIDTEPSNLIAICARKNSPLAKIGEKYIYPRVYDFELPSKKDGFLATNSLLAFLVLLGRVYGPHIGEGLSLPSKLLELLPKFNGIDDAFNDLRTTCKSVFERDYLTVLYGPGMETVAYDIESKFTEAALCAVQISDFRNFAHGRHHWLAKRGKQSAIIAFTNASNHSLAQRTLRLIPSSIPSAIINIPGNIIASSIGAVVSGFILTGIAGELRGIDPGRPGVPQFGRRLYHLGIGSPEIKYSIEKAPVRRKLNICFAPSQKINMAYKVFSSSLKSVSFCGLVLDYDGTLCEFENRFNPLDNRIVQEISRLLLAGISIGIATGRGKSVKKNLREVLPESQWKQVLVGYYNGAECAFLDNDNAPDGSSNPSIALGGIAKILSSDENIKHLAKMTIRKQQISIEPNKVSQLDFLWEVVGGHLFRSCGVKMVQSSHSIDIISSSVTKRNVVVEMLAKCKIGNNSNILCIGDQGRWPGNDSDLLAEKYSLSVDVVSPDLNTCWNLAPAGYRGHQATLFYLKCLVASQGSFQYIPLSKGGRR